MHGVAMHVTAMQGTCLGKYVFNNVLEKKLLYQIVMLTVTFFCSSCCMIDGTEYPQEYNKTILLLASFDKHGITLILYYVIPFTPEM